MKNKQIYTNTINFILIYDKNLKSYFTSSNCNLEISYDVLERHELSKPNNFNKAIKNILEEKYGYENVIVTTLKP
jgi:hypothetical protein